MLDVHPPHSPTHTWRDFLLHIATIVVGLLIAIGLEQTVEYFHHRRQLYEAREAIHAELEYNDKLLQESLTILFSTQQTMQRNAALLRDPNTPAGTPTSALIYDDWGVGYPRSNAWQDAKANGAVEFMAPGERARADFIYGDSDLAEKFIMSWLEDNNIAAALAHRAPTIAGLTPQEREQLLQVTARTEADLVSCAILITTDQHAIQRYLSFPAQSGKQVR
jgi:hypothetical protein